MKICNLLLLAAISLVLSGAVYHTVYADDDAYIGGNENAAMDQDNEQSQAEEIHHIMQAKIHLTDAMKAAEEKTGGLATEGVLDDDMAMVHYKVDILKDGQLLDVIVDGMTGKVLKVYADKED